MKRQDPGPDGHRYPVVRRTTGLKVGFGLPNPLGVDGTARDRKEDHRPGGRRRTRKWFPEDAGNTRTRPDSCPRGSDPPGQGWSRTYQTDPCLVGRASVPLQSRVGPDPTSAAGVHGFRPRVGRTSTTPTPETPLFPANVGVTPTGPSPPTGLTVWDVGDTVRSDSPKRTPTPPQGLPGVDVTRGKGHLGSSQPHPPTLRRGHDPWTRVYRSTQGPDPSTPGSTRSSTHLRVDRRSGWTDLWREGRWTGVPGSQSCPGSRTHGRGVVSSPTTNGRSRQTAPVRLSPGTRGTETGDRNRSEAERDTLRDP